MHHAPPTHPPTSIPATFVARVSTVLLAAIWASLAPGIAQQTASSAEAAAPPVLELVEVVVEPSRPTAETLCQLTVRLRNRGERPISSLAFEVEVEGKSLPVYEKQVFMTLVPPSAPAGPNAASTVDLRLFNFWASESNRPPPTDGTLDIQIRLIEAQWVDVSMEDDGTEVWSLAEPVPGLPQVATISVPMSND